MLGNEFSAYAAESDPIVYMTTEMTPQSFVNIYVALGFNAEGNVAVRMSTGKAPDRIDKI